MIFKKFEDYLISGSKEVQMYKQLITTLLILMLIYFGNVWLGAKVLSVNEPSIWAKIEIVMYLGVIKIGYILIFLITFLNTILFGLKIFRKPKVSVHLVIGHMLNLLTMLAVIFIVIYI